MSLLDFWRRSKPQSSARTAKDRLQLILAHERLDRAQPDYLPRLQNDILAVIRNYVEVASDKVKVRLQRGDRLSVLEIEIELATPRALAPTAAAAAPSSAFAR